MSVRDQIKADNADRVKKNQKPQLPDASRLKTLAQKFFTTQLNELAGDQDFQAPTKDQVTKAVDMVVQGILSDKQKAPTKFSKDLISRLKAKAAELAGSTPRSQGNFLSRLFSDEPTSPKNLKPIIDKVSRGLLEFMKGPVPKALLGLAPTESTTKVLDPETKRFIEQIAREAVQGPGGQSQFSDFFDAAKLHIRLSQNEAQTLNAVASELDVPGAVCGDSPCVISRGGSTIQSPGQALHRLRLPPDLYRGALRSISNLDRIRIDAGDNFSTTTSAT